MMNDGNKKNAVNAAAGCHDVVIGPLSINIHLMIIFGV